MTIDPFGIARAAACLPRARDVDAAARPMRDLARPVALHRGRADDEVRPVGRGVAERRRSPAASCRGPCRRRGWRGGGRAGTRRLRSGAGRGRSPALRLAERQARSFGDSASNCAKAAAWASRDLSTAPGDRSSLSLPRRLERRNGLSRPGAAAAGRRGVQDALPTTCGRTSYTGRR